MNPPTILIVEDEAIVAADLASKLRQLGYGIAGTVADGEEAVEMARRHQPGLVLMDIRLAGTIDGIAAAELIRREHGLPVVFLTAHSDAATLERAKLAEPFGYIIKPFEESELRATIEIALHKNQADQMVRQQREWLRVTLASIGDAVVACDPQCRVTFLNPVAETLTGWSTQEALGQPIQRVLRLINEQTRQPCDDVVARVLQEGRSVSLTNHTALLARDGREIPIADSAAPILDAAGRVIGAVLVFHDVTEKRRAQTALESAHARTLSILESVGDGFFSLDRQWRVTYVNERGARLLGRSRRDLLGRSLWESFPEAVGSAFQRTYERVLADQASAAVEAFYPPLDAWFEARAYPSAEGLSIFFQDITQRKKTEMALAEAHTHLERLVEERTARLRETVEKLRSEIRVRRQAEEKIKEAEFRYRTVADFTYDWEYWQAPDLALRYCSPSVERITGYTAAELDADPQLLDRMVHSEDQSLWEEHKRGGFAAPGERTVLFRVLRKDGGIRWIEHSCRSVIGSQGEFLGIRAANRDVTERKQAEMKMQQLREELARTTRITAAGQLSAALAHELNQPLGAIVCNVQAIEQLLARPTPDLQEVREALKDIEADSKRAGEVIHQLRALYQKTGQAKTPLQFNEILQGTAHLLNSEFVLKEVALRLEVDPRLPLVRGNAVELQQVVLNLFTNALEAMVTQPPEARHLRVRTLSDGPKIIRVSVCDSGVGLGQEQLSRVFEPFYTTKPSGMGMGLAICHSIIEAHGGRLWAENNPDRGATFHLTLPAFLADPS